MSKLFEVMDLTGHRTDANLTPQVALYDDGVGTETFKPPKISLSSPALASAGTSSGG